MSRKRSISTDISVDPKLAALAEFGTLPLLLYTWAIPHADDYGRITADALQFKLMVCPALPVTAKEVSAALDDIASVGLWERGEKAIQFPPASWFKHQSYISATKREQPEKAGGVAQKNTTSEEQRKTPKNAEERRETAQNASSPSPTPSPSVANATVPRVKSAPKEPDLPEREGGGKTPNAVGLFVEHFQRKFDGERPDIPDKFARNLMACEKKFGRQKFDAALCAYFRDEWASQQGFNVGTFLSQPLDRWLRAASKPPTFARGDPPPFTEEPVTMPYPSKFAPAAARNGTEP